MNNAFSRYGASILRPLLTPLLVLLLVLGPARTRADEWQLLPFAKVDGVNPCLSPRAESEFMSPLDGRVKWEEAHVFNPAAVVRDGKVWLNWMYFRDSKFLLAHSDDLLHWRAVVDEHGKPRSVVGARPKQFDSDLVEPGPPALLREDGILLPYNGVNAKQGGDASLPAGNFASGQLLFDRHDPARVLRRSDAYFLTPDRPYEITGQVGNVCFLEGLVQFKGSWFLYYGTADSKIAVAVCKAHLR